MSKEIPLLKYVVKLHKLDIWAILRKFPQVKTATLISEEAKDLLY